MTHEEIMEQLDRVVKVRNRAYNRSFNDARRKTAKAVAEKYLHENPNATMEQVRDYVADYIAEEPDEFQRNLRVYVNLGTTIFSSMRELITLTAEIKDLFVIANREKIEEAGRIYAEQQEKLKKINEQE